MTDRKTDEADSASYADQVLLYQAVFLMPYNAAIESGGDAALLNHALMSAGMEAAVHNYGPGPAIAWLRKLANDLEGEYPPDAARH